MKPGRLALIASATLAGGLVLGGCTTPQTRPEVSQSTLLKARTTGDEQAAAGAEKLRARMLQRVKAEHDRYAAGPLKTPPVIDILIVSGGGDWGRSARDSSRGGGRFPPSTRSPGRSSTS